MVEHENNPEANADEERLSRLSGSATPTPDDVVWEYEARYTTPDRPKRKPKPRSYSTSRVDADDKLWAAAAHGSVWVTFLAAVPTSGLSIPFVVFVPLVLYVLFRKRSDFVAFHALQAFTLQLICTVGALAVFAVGCIVWLIGLAVAALLMLILVGFVILPLWVIVGMVLSVLVSLLPMVGLVLATIAVVRIYSGGDYRYPYISDWVDRQIAGGFLNA
jgi:uncharacterized Tic20 family protein